MLNVKNEEGSAFISNENYNRDIHFSTRSTFLKISIRSTLFFTTTQVTKRPPIHT